MVTSPNRSSVGSNGAASTGKHHIIMVGSGGVGKTALASRIRDGSFPTSYHPTRVDSFNKVIVVDGEKCTLDILDTAGQESFTAMRDNYYRGGDGFFCVFSIDDRSSFDALKQYHEHICRVIDREDMPVLLVASKADLEEQRKVSREEALALAMSWGPSCHYMETSAKEDQEVLVAFENLARRIMHEKKEREPLPASTQSCCIIC